MSGAKHTPGSWTVEDKRSLNDAFWIEVQHPDGYSVSIAEVRDGCDEAAELGCMEANARLIAAAPCMFEYILSSAQNGCATAQEIVERATGDRPEKGEQA